MKRTTALGVDAGKRNGVLLAALAEGFSVFFTRDGQMLKLKNAVVKFLKAEDGPTAVEYAVMLALIIVVCIAAISALGSNASNTFNYVGNKISTTSS